MATPALQIQSLFLILDRNGGNRISVLSMAPDGITPVDIHTGYTSRIRYTPQTPKLNTSPTTLALTEVAFSTTGLIWSPTLAGDLATLLDVSFNAVLEISNDAFTTFSVMGKALNATTLPDATDTQLSI